MKKPSLFFLFLSVCITVTAHQHAGHYSISGSLRGIKGTVDKVLINYRISNVTITDTVPVANGKFFFNGGSLTEPVKARMFVEYAPFMLVLRDLGRDELTLFIQPGVPVSITCVRDSLVNAEINGGPLNQEWQKIVKAEKQYNEEETFIFSSRHDALKNYEYVRAHSLMKAQLALWDTIAANVYKKYVTNNPTSPIALFGLKDYAQNNFNPAVIGALYKKLPFYQKKYSAGKWLGYRIEVANTIVDGKKAPAFILPDTTGNYVGLSNFKGKYVLLNFWASSWQPNQRANRGMAAIYSRFKAKGFVVLGISSDKPSESAEWLKIVHHDNPEWQRLFDAQNIVTKQYGAPDMCQTVLIDPRGKIIAKNIWGNELETKLTQIYTN